MRKILIIFSHPRFEKSRANRALLSGLPGHEWLTIHDLYEQYPDFNIDVAREKELLLAHQIVVWHYPLYMYGAPAMIKQWIDLVLEHGWAHGAGGGSLKKKLIFTTITTGGTRDSYSRQGFNRYTLSELLLPLEQTAHLCGMTWLPPFAVQGTYLLTDSMLAEYADQYRRVLLYLAQSPSLDTIDGYEFLNDWITEMDRREKP
jgi:glutathione-regulated potassium-efflux system ancillary protein KefG